MKKTPPYTISRVRLINFHNFVDETITIPENGHLFLLGDNGCGKTTVLDAIHYVLTAGRAMEWNSAARVVKRRRDGRRLQGVILRYNMETGIMNRDGSITYAAVEIVGRNGRPLTIGLGMSVLSMDETVKPWGVIRECALDEIPFLMEDEHGRRPASKREFKQALGSSRGFYRDAASYRRELATRLFGNADSYGEICRFLKMGKAYREIAAGAADYHELFKQLLPEPHTSIFEQIIDGLRSLDSSRSLLDDLAQKVEYVRSLQHLVESIGAQKEAICRYDWLLCHWNLQENGQQQEAITEAVSRLTLEQDQAESRLVHLKKEKRQFQERLDDLKARDSSGLVRQEENCKAELIEKKARLVEHVSRLQARKKAMRRAEQENRKQQKALTEQLGRLVSECGRRARSLPFSIASLQQEADQLFRSPEAESCEQMLGTDIFATMEEQIQEFTAQSVLLADKITQSRQELAGLDRKLVDLRKQKDPQPEQDIASCIRSLRNRMITPRPLYLGLEWLPGLSRQQQGYIEEAIGEEVLATLLVRDEDYPACCSEIISWPGIRVSCKSRTREDLPDWMRTVFDIPESDPVALRCLGGEMESNRAPSVRQLERKNLLSFRSHERTLFESPARLIGAESRKQTLLREIAALEEEYANTLAGQKKQEQQLKSLQGKKAALHDFKKILTAFLNIIHSQARLVIKAQQEQCHCQQRYDQQKEIHDEQQLEVENLTSRGRELKKLISGQGLEGLERRINTMEKRCRKAQDTIDQANKELGSILEKIKERAAQKNQRIKQAETLQMQLADKETSLAALLAEDTDIAYYVLKSKTGHRFTSSEAIAKKWRDADRQAIQLIEELKVKINDPRFGAAFRFYYEKADNEVRDFRSRLISDILPEQEQATREQQELINDHTRELFKRIIMTDLMNYLRSHVSSLELMMRNINSLLQERSFGGQQYRFRVRPLDTYKQLIQVIKKFSSFDPEAEKEVRHFFEDHSDDIMAAEVGAVPDELDYRNWYRYEMEVFTKKTSGNDKGVVMDRATKAIGSGGEQAVPNYLLILTIAHFLYRGKNIRLHTLLFDEAFYGIDAGRRDQLLGFATDLNLQLFVASPDQDGVRREISHSTTLFVVKDTDFNIHLRDFHWENPNIVKQRQLFEEEKPQQPIAFGEEL